MKTNRCKHDLEILTGRECADCLGLPDVPLIDDLDDREIRRARGPVPADRDRHWRERDVDGFVPCVRCGERISDPHQATWSPADAGHIGPCCDSETE